MAKDEHSQDEGRLVRVYFAAPSDSTPPQGHEAPALPPSPPGAGTEPTRPNEITRIEVKRAESMSDVPEKPDEQPKDEQATRPAIKRSELPPREEVQPLVFQTDIRLPVPEDQRSKPTRMLFILGLLLVIISIASVAVGWAVLSGTDLGQLVQFPAGVGAAEAASATPGKTGGADASPEAVATEAPLSASTPRPTATAAATPTPTGPSAVIELGGGRMVYVPGGTFIMGNLEAGDDAPPHEVTLDPYYIDATEVTNAQWEACVAAGECLAPGDLRAYDGSPYYGEAAFASYPVIYVNWNDARAFCEWRGARLPSEAEWEMASTWDPATNATTLYPWGDEWGPLRANHCDASCILSGNAETAYDDAYPQTAPVGSFPGGRSPAGALDMAGNVAEWVADWYGPYSIDAAINPRGPETGSLRVVRGGAWGVGALGMISSRRSSYFPTDSGPGVGFRCAVSLEDS